jgi:hypothetical protein
LDDLGIRAAVFPHFGGFALLGGMASWRVGKTVVDWGLCDPTHAAKTKTRHGWGTEHFSGLTD